MRSVRTLLHKFDKPGFRIFLDGIGLPEVIVGDYEHIDSGWYKQECICYAYSEKSVETVAILTHITLKYGNLGNAYTEYIRDIYNSELNQPTFNWTP
jgi:hypothetical protein